MMIPSLAMILSTAWLASGSSDLRRVQSVSPTTPAATATTEDPHTCDFYCQFLNGPSSYCKYWLSHRACQGGEQPCSIDVCNVPDGASVATLPTPSPDDVEVCDRYCMLLNGPSSYCKWWQSPAVCHSGGQPCGDVTICLAPIIGTSTYDLVGDQHGGPSPACDSYCQDLNDESSYCKYWQNPAVCLSGDQPCGPSVCDTTTSVVSVSTTPTPTTIPALSTTLVSDTSSVRTTFTSPLFGGDSDSTATTFDGCDTYCKALNNEYSYCKYWLDKPVCQSGEQPCGLSVC